MSETALLTVLSVAILLLLCLLAVQSARLVRKENARASDSTQNSNSLASINTTLQLMVPALSSISRSNDQLQKQFKRLK